MGKVGKIAKAAVLTAATGGAYAAVKTGQFAKKKLVDEPRAAREAELEAQRQEVAAAEAAQKEFQISQDNATQLAEQTAIQKTKRARQRTSGAGGRRSTILTGSTAAGGNAPGGALLGGGGGSTLLGV